MVVDCVKRPESGRRFDVSLDGVGWWSRGVVRGESKRVTFLLVIRDDTCSKLQVGVRAAERTSSRVPYMAMLCGN